ncbi:hypothetical protein [Actinocatenispora comari]|uniref:Uncharacterized protein n=1 Tax=Actinocatenispora comari TaxID=2807577 RepID=A0A8J4EMB4_9ACTN|nr:hypothetical protein [Actinocatenispora comari]GIL28658.1 hypothetical protein NUM_39120 [Actinocatenispora comari]
METELPLRPMTVGELLDASVVLLRRGWPPLVALGLVVALGQQALVGLVAPMPASVWSDPTGFWLWLGAWLGTESAAIAILAAPASVAAARTVVGDPVGRRTLLTAPGRRWPAVLGLAVLIGAVAAGAVFACGLPWAVAYAACGLVVPVLVADRATGGQVIARPLVLLVRGSCRAGGIRLLGYLGWLTVRFAVGIGAQQLLDRSPVAVPFAAAIGWVVVDAIAYPALACLDACLHLENRMRTEGLDLALATASARRRRTVLEAIR